MEGEVISHQAAPGSLPEVAHFFSTLIHLLLVDGVRVIDDGNERTRTIAPPVDDRYLSGASNGERLQRKPETPPERRFHCSVACQHMHPTCGIGQDSFI